MDKKIIVSSDTKRANRIPPGQHETKKWPVLHSGQVHLVNKSEWSFRIFGLVKEEKILTYDKFINLPKVEVISDIHCVTTWSKLDNRWEGVRTQTIAELIEVLPDAQYVMVHAAGGFTTNLSLDDFLAEDALFAYKHDNEELTSSHGGPVRLVVPKLYFWKSAKWVTGIEFMAQDKPGYWEAGGYHMHGDPWKEERYA